MTLYYDSKQKLINVGRTIENLLEGDFPLNSGKTALQRLARVFEELGRKLDRAKKLNDDSSEKQIAALINVKTIEVLPILGFILRSTNVRNAFELLDPLQIIANSILQGNAQLLLSSEWDYVPFAYPQSLEDLKSFVLIGMPASETSNALLVPLAGHELGHAVWRNRGLGGGAHATLQYKCEDLFKAQKNMEDFCKYFPEYKPNDIVGKEILLESIAGAVEDAVFQAEELFCDMFAYSLFGPSYVHAFTYILAPGSGRMSGTKYPSHKTRISVLKKIAEAEGDSVPDIDALRFSDEAPRSNPRERFLLRMTETSVAEVTDGLWNLVKDLITAGKVTRPNNALTNKHLKEFRLGIPASAPKSLGDIINAGWMLYRELQSDGITKDVMVRQVSDLNEMILKTVEVLEFRRRVESGP
jgi:hypothetical protein